MSSYQPSFFLPGLGGPGEVETLGGKRCGVQEEVKSSCCRDLRKPELRSDLPASNDFKTRPARMEVMILSLPVL